MRKYINQQSIKQTNELDILQLIRENPKMTRKQIETALQWGIDGFCVDIIADPKLYKRMMARFFRHAEGYDFKIALCIDQMNYPLEHTATHLADFIRTYREHPNSCPYTKTF